MEPYCQYSCYDWYDCYGYGLLSWEPTWDTPSWTWIAPETEVWTYEETVCLGPTAMEQYTPPQPSVSISSASIPGDNIGVVLAPAGISGTLTVQVVGGTNHTVFTGAKAGGTHDINFNIPNLPNGEFTQVRARWVVTGGSAQGERSYHFKVLGTYEQTKYNTPTEAYCAGPSSQFLYTDGQCLGDPGCSDTHSANRKDQWFAELWENGSGYHSTLQYMSREWVCQAPARQVPGPCPKCEGSLTVGQDVAVNPSHPHLDCGDVVYIHGLGTRTVRDHGGGLAEARLDHYIGTGGCNKHGGSYGSMKTIKLY